MSKKTIITAAITGAMGTKKENPNHPVTPEEIAESVLGAWKAGAAIAHLHMRDENQQGTMDLELFRRTIKLIREAGCDIILNLTTAGGLNLTEEDRIAVVPEFEPEIATYDSGSMNFGHAALFDNNPRFLEKLGNTMIKHGVKPEVECFCASHIEIAKHYIKQGSLKEPVHFQFCLGIGGGMAATAESIVHMKSLIPAGSTWSAFGIGSGHKEVLLTTMGMGGHIRVGFEDNFYRSRGVRFNSNAEQVERVVNLLKEFGLEHASPDEAREILGIKKRLEKNIY